MFKDAFGREISVGDYVVYGKSFGRSAGLGVGKVIEVREKLKEVGRVESRDPWKYVYDKVPSGEFVLDVMTLQGWKPIEKPERCYKTVLQYSERVLIVSSSEIPEVQRGILDEAYNIWMERKS